MSAFIETLAPYAMKHGAEANVLPSLIIAQGILESASGKSELAVQANNLFGIKKGSGWEGEVHAVVTGEYRKNEAGEDEYYEIVAEFRKYPSYEGAVIDLCAKYTQGLDWESHNRYAAVVGEKDFATAANAVKAAGYATDPNYPAKLINIYDTYSLWKYENNKEETTMKVVIDAGHGRNTAGKRTPAGEREWTFNDKVARAVIAELNNYSGVEILRVDDPTGNTDVGLTARTAKANSWGGSVYVSIHHNANTGKWGTWTGVETFVYTTTRDTDGSMKLAKAVHPRLVDAMGLKDRGIKKANFAVIRQTRMPAILTEGGYMDSTIDIVKMRNDAVLKNAGIAIAQGIAAYGGLKRTGGPTQVVKPAAPEDKGYLEYGDRGDRVQAMQEYLNEVGFAVEVTGYYNAATKRAVMDFQESRGLTVDGIYGVGSLAEMNKALKEKGTLYRVRKTWEDAGSQLGAFSDLAGATAIADANPGYSVFDGAGNATYAKKVEAPKEEAQVANTDGKNDLPSASLVPEFKEAVKEGITDGTYPNRPATRAEVAVMIIRAVKMLRK